MRPLVKFIIIRSFFFTINSLILKIGWEGAKSLTSEEGKVHNFCIANLLAKKQQHNLWGFGRGIKQSDPRSKGTNFLIQSSDSILL